MIRRNVHWMAALQLATKLAVTDPSGLMAGTGASGGTNNGDADYCPKI